MPENDLTPISMPDFVGSEDTFLSRSTPSDGVSVKYFLRKEDKAAVAKVRFGSEPESPPRCAHGGSIASVLDESMGAACWVNGHTVLGARLNVRFRRPVPLGRDVDVTARIVGVRGRTINAKASMRDAETNRVYAEAAGVYVKVEPGKSGR